MKKKIVCLLMGCLLIANSCIKPVDAFVVRDGTAATSAAVTGAQAGEASNGDQGGADDQTTDPNVGQQNDAHAADIPVERVRLADEMGDLNDVHKFENGITLRSSNQEGSLKPSKASNDGGMVKYAEAEFIRCNTVIRGEDQREKPKIDFIWLTASNCNVIFENLEITGKIQMTTRCKVEFRNCYIHDSLRISHDPIVDIFVNSSAAFENCEIENKGNSDCCVRIYTNSHADLRKCRISNSGKKGVVVEGESSVHVSECHFESCAVHVNIKSNGLIEKCEFDNIEGPAIISSKSCELEVSGCSFNNVNKGVRASESCKVIVEGCRFGLVNVCGVDACGKCDMQVLGCVFNKSGIKLERSSGFVKDCEFIDSDVPTVYIFGCEKVSIHHCRFSENKEHPFIRVRFNSTIMLNGIRIDDFNEQVPVISCTDLSSVVLTGLDIGSKDKIPEIMVCNASKFKILPLKSCLVKVFKEDGKEEDFNSSSECSLGRIHVTEKTFGEVLVLDPEEVRVAADVALDVIDCTDVKIEENQEESHVISGSCGHPIACPECGKHMVLEESNQPKRERRSNQLKRERGSNQLKCEHCGTKINLEEKTFSCHICKTKVANPIKEFCSSECVLLSAKHCDEHADVIFLPCGHRCVCRYCVVDFLKEGCTGSVMKCPSCAQPSNVLTYGFTGG